MPQERSVDRRTRRTIGAIKKAFWDIAEVKGIDKVTVSEIAERADINRKTFYHHYDSIETLEDELLQEEFDLATEPLKDAIVVTDGVLDVHKLFQAISAQIAIVASRDGASLANVDAGRFVRHIEPMLVKTLPEKAPELYEGVPEPCMRYVVTFFCSGLITSYRRWLDDDSEVDMEELAAILGACLTGGISGVREWSQQA